MGAGMNLHSTTERFQEEWRRERAEMVRQSEEALLPQHPTPMKAYLRCMSYAGDELKSFRSCLRWMCMDQSSPCRLLLSWSLFLLLGIAVPSFSHFVLSYSSTRRPYDAVVQLSLSAASTLAFLRLSTFLRRYGLRRLLSLDRVRRGSDRVRLEYHAELSRSFRLMATFVVPCFAAEVGYKIWWYCTGAERIPFIGREAIPTDAIACILELASWVYRNSIFFLVCILFRLICHLQILRLQDFAAVFQNESDVAAVLREHLLIRRQLRVISHRFRSFIVSSIVLVTASQLGMLLLTTRPRALVNLSNGGELALCSIGLGAGLLICLNGAAKITHKAQALTSHAAKWHVCSTIDSYEVDPETPSSATSNGGGVSIVEENESDEEDAAVEDELEDTNLLKPHPHTISFQKRQALVSYLENNGAGITVFGTVLDRAWIHTVVMLQLSLVLWLLGKTIGIS